MLENKNTSLTPLSTIGEFPLIKHLTKKFSLDPSLDTECGIGDDSAVLSKREHPTLVSSDLLIENIHFDLSYVPLKHLGYKAIMVNLSDIFAMNGTPTQVLVNIAVSNRFTLEALEELYEGIALACKRYKVDLIGGDTSSATKGLTLSITVLGTAKKENIAYRKGAKKNDLLVVSGDIGAAYMGLQVLEREKEVFKVNPKSQPDLSPYTYCIERQLKPEARKDVIDLLEKLKIVPTSMIDISDGLSSECIHLCKSSKVGCRLYEEKIPMDPEMLRTCDELSIPNMTAAFQGGEDYELLFTINPSDYEKIKDNPLVSVIGHITDENEGYYWVTGLGQSIELEAQGWDALKK